MTDELKRDGAAIARGVLSPEEVKRLREAFEAADDAALQRGGAVYAARQALEIPAVRACARSGEAYRLAREILGEEARPVRGILFDKRPEANWPVAWHQDVTIAVRKRHDAAGYGPWSVKGGIPHVQPPADVLERMVTVRLHLDDCPASNGALRVIPGSHRLGKLSPDEIATHTRRPALACEAMSGDAVLMRPLVLHSSSPAEAPSHRRVVHIEYAAGGPGARLAWAEAVG